MNDEILAPVIWSPQSRSTDAIHSAECYTTGVTHCASCGLDFQALRVGGDSADPLKFCPGCGAQASSSDPFLGRVLLGQFELREVCGRGAMGTVYRAYQTHMEREVAVKILNAEILQSDPKIGRRFSREARAAARLSHPNIVTVHLIGETEEKLPYLVMEHIAGESLEDLLAPGTALPPRDVLQLGRQIASALGEAHAHGVVHRDLKPANILVIRPTASRPSTLVKVLDFGIAKILRGQARPDSELTEGGLIFGTPHYIAPEQASGDLVDARADLYSLGVVLFQMATGRVPFAGNIGMEVVLRHLRETPPSPRDFAPNLPLALEELILHCLAKAPDDRPMSAVSIVARIEEIDEALRIEEAGVVRALERRNTSAIIAAQRQTRSRWAVGAAFMLSVAVVGTIAMTGERNHSIASASVMPASIAASKAVELPLPAKSSVESVASKVSDNRIEVQGHAAVAQLPVRHPVKPSADEAIAAPRASRKIGSHELPHKAVRTESIPLPPKSVIEMPSLSYPPAVVEPTARPKVAPSAVDDKLESPLDPYPSDSEK